MKHVDVLGVGIGPFNLSLAALLEEGTELNAVFFDENDHFEWHPGMLIDRTDLQISFIADLVTLANPRSEYTFLNYLHEHERMFPFYFFKEWNVPRKEYNAYCQWVAKKVSSLAFGKRVVDVRNEGTFYTCTIEDVKTKSQTVVTANHVVVGTGSTPMFPPAMEDNRAHQVIHSSEYTFHAEEIKRGDRLTVVGSGQSAAEIFYDLLENQIRFGYSLTWLTRSPGFFQLEESKLGQEKFTPDYVDHFHRLSFDERQNVLGSLTSLRNGVEGKTLKSIYELLYHRTAEGEIPVSIQSSVEVNGLSDSDHSNHELQCKQWQEGRNFELDSDWTVLATGYQPQVPDFIERMKDDLVWEGEGLPKVERDYRLSFMDKREHLVFMLTNLEHSHGTSATNLALSVTRNIEIINSMTKNHPYKLKRSHPFQQF
ncbi:lysine N(6)-hydroxylase/L-ornithine N(5)-oxygenase family protein [Geomicrobium sp. JSM 1781026]|uniref:lysine N(6)-hydroxylase/L-ornithine N(5)-oxygenase family protein n=1 Tax=Geomicrobium sp. JSM 1781026 TaxID=3344580 RepID=UPI0035C21CBF